MERNPEGLVFSDTFCANRFANLTNWAIIKLLIMCQSDNHINLKLYSNISIGGQKQLFDNIKQLFNTVPIKHQSIMNSLGDF